PSRLSFSPDAAGGALPGPMFPLASQSAYHWLLYSLKE
ncbi:hypothetical protein LTSEWAN_4323, partial [Salmonella enterica subsp. enterica serovar Wandsworth str. A4-580]